MVTMDKISSFVGYPDVVTPKLLSIVFVAFAVFTLKALYDGLFNPLSSVPGPWYARWTDLPLRFAIIKGRRIMFVHDLHMKYGPYVLIAPDHVSVYDHEGFSKIHKIGTPFVKSSCMSDRKMHAERRKLYARPFSKANIQTDHESTVHGYVRSAVMQMKASGTEGHPVDILKWWMLMASDVVSKLMLGKCFDGIQRGEMNDHLRAVKTSTKGKGMLIELPNWVGYILRRVPIHAVQQLFNPNPMLKKYGQLALEGGKAEGGEVLFANAIREAEVGNKLDDFDVLVEATGLIVAGTDTTANTLTYLVWAVLSRPHWQNLLEEEVSKLPESFTSGEIEKLPILNAIIGETLRLYGAAPGGLPRVVPPGGSEFGNHFLPAGTIVSTQAYSYHRDPNLFPDPFKFDPNRFLAESDAKLSPAALTAYHPFGAGSHACLGIHLAQMELRLATAEFFRTCRGARLAPTTTDDSMEMVNFFLILPKGFKCEILL